MSGDYIASWLSPETIAARAPTATVASKTALASGKWSSPIQTNTLGAAGYYIYPGGVVGAATGLTSLLTVLNDAAFVPSTGVSGGIGYVSGPLSA